MICFLYMLCVLCNSEFDPRDCGGLDSDRCRPCFISTLSREPCSGNKKKLCDRWNCHQCFLRSFASVEKCKYWDYSFNSCWPIDVFKRKVRDYYYFECTCDHGFEALLADVTKGVWCPYCVGRKRLCSFDCNDCFARSFASHAASKYWHEDNTVTPRQIALHSIKRFKFTCPYCQCTYMGRPDDIANKGAECPKCLYKTEYKLLQALTKAGYNVESQVSFGWCKNIRCLPFDFSIGKVLIECDGEQHFRDVTRFKNNATHTRERDIYKMKCALAHGYRIVRLVQEDVWLDKIKWYEQLIDAIAYDDRIIYISSDPEKYKFHQEEMAK